MFMDGTSLFKPFRTIVTFLQNDLKRYILSSGISQNGVIKGISLQIVSIFRSRPHTVVYVLVIGSRILPVLNPNISWWRYQVWKATLNGFQRIVTDFMTSPIIESGAPNIKILEPARRAWLAPKA